MYNKNNPLARNLLRSRQDFAKIYIENFNDNSAEVFCFQKPISNLLLKTDLLFSIALFAITLFAVSSPGVLFALRFLIYVKIHINKTYINIAIAKL